MNGSNNVILHNISKMPANLSRIGPSNITTSSSATFNNNLIASFSIVFAIATVILNGLILTTFVKHTHLRASFNIYVMNLAVIDILVALFPMTMNVIKLMYGSWPFDAILCSIWLFINQMANAANRAVHLLIAGNRLWAVTSPVTYRNHHTYGLAVALAIGGWTFTLSLVIPEIVFTREKVNHSLSVQDRACAYDSFNYPVYHFVFNMVLYNLPEVIILIAYACLVLKLRQKMRNRMKTEPTATSGVQSGKTRSVKLNDLKSGTLSETGPTDTELADGVDLKARKPSSRSRSNDRLFAYLVLSVIICWTPNHVYWLWSGFTGFWNTPFFNVQYFLSYANSWLNPILIYIADSQIRKAVNQLVKCG